MKCKYKKSLPDENFCKIACRYCTGEQERNCKSKIPDGTNADQIRSMSDEEMASQLCDLAYDRWYNGVFDDGDEGERLLDWLRQPAEE